MIFSLHSNKLIMLIVCVILSVIIKGENMDTYPCPNCGYVELYFDSKKLKSIIPKKVTVTFAKHLRRGQSDCHLECCTGLDALRITNLLSWYFLLTIEERGAEKCQLPFPVYVLLSDSYWPGLFVMHYDASTSQGLL